LVLLETPALWFGAVTPGIAGGRVFFWL
jgi:hypothetical protein